MIWQWLKQVHETYRRRAGLMTKREANAVAFHIQKTVLELHHSLISRIEGTRPDKRKRIAPRPRTADGLAESLEEIRRLSPAIYQLWCQCQARGERTYEDDPLGNCSVAGHEHAELFRHYVACYVDGTVLDIGCGPQPIPEYLRGIPVEQIAGLDPIGTQDMHPFVFYRGLAEFLPWDNESFDYVVAATSMDHFILIDRCLEEIRRVLHRNGTWLVWIGFHRGAPEFDPYSANPHPIDRHHLFHFDRPWFERWVQMRFTIQNCFELYNGDYSEAFYALAPNPLP